MVSAVRQGQLPVWVLLLLFVGPGPLAGIGGLVGANSATGEVKAALDKLEHRSSENTARIAHMATEAEESQRHVRTFVEGCSAERTTFIQAMQRAEAELDRVRRQVERIDRSLRQHMDSDAGSGTAGLAPPPWWLGGNSA